MRNSNLIKDMTLKIGINGLYINRPNVGIGRYIYNFVSGLNDLDLPHQFYLIVPSKYKLTGLNLKNNFETVIVPPVNGTIDDRKWSKNILLSQEVNQCNLDILFIPFNQWVHPNGQTKILITIHDIIPILPLFINRTLRYPQLINYTTIKRFFSLFFDLYRVKNNRQFHITTVSDFTKGELIKLLKFSTIQITTCHNVISSDFAPKSAITQKPLLDKLGIKNEYFLFVGSAIKRKNVEGCIKAYVQLSKSIKNTYKLVLVGSFDKPGPAQKLISKFNLWENVIVLNDLSNKELITLYQYATIFIFPSFYEGFGYPVLEALACGCPVICSRCCSILEVAGNATLFVDPHSPNDINQKILYLLNNEEVKLNNIQQGLKQAQKFNIQVGSQKLVRLIENLGGLLRF